MAKFLHTADWHLGKGFHSFSEDEDIRARLRSTRFEALDRIGHAARTHGCSAILVAGDLFHSNEVEDRVLVTALEKIGRMGLPVIAIPGNHDHAGAASIWERKRFQKERASLAPNLVLVTDKVTCLPIDGVDVLVAPVLQRFHQQSLVELADVGARDGRPRLGLVHSSTVDFSETGTGRGGLQLIGQEKASLDYLALGDFHRRQAVSGIHCEAWYAGTHEPDAFPSHHQDGERRGGCIVVELERGRKPVVSEVDLEGGLRWIRAIRNLRDEASIDQLLADFDRWIAAGMQTTVCQIDLTGSRLGLTQRTRLQAELQDRRDRCLALQIEGSIDAEPTDAELEELRLHGGLVGSVASRLRAKIAQSPESTQRERLALSRLHELVTRGDIR
jgi:DNA repair exonuclease SbcCD nuclease subunit